MNIGENIRKLRLENKLTQSALANMVGLATSTIAKYENNQLEPNIEKLKNIADALHSSLINLLKEKDLEEVKLKGILSNTDNKSPLNQQIVANLIDNVVNSPSSIFYDMLSDYLTSKNIEDSLSCSNLTTGELQDLSSFLFYMLKLKLTEINFKHK